MKGMDASRMLRFAVLSLFYLSSTVMTGKPGRTFAKFMAPFLAPATARVERRQDRANIVGKLLLSFGGRRKEVVGGGFGCQCLVVEGRYCSGR